MPLGIDASIYYAVELEKNIATYTQRTDRSAAADQLALQHAHAHRSAADADLQPGRRPRSRPPLTRRTLSYLYYVAAADGCGEQVFSDTQAAFEANVAAYEAAEQKNGGHPPACKKK